MDVINEVRAPRRAKAVLRNLVANRQLTESGLKYLDVATDPFHDADFSCDGFPDISPTKSLVQCVTKTFNVASSAGTNTWFCHVFFCPVTPSFCRQDGVDYPDLYFSTVTADGTITQTLPPTKTVIKPGWNVLTGVNDSDWYSTQATSSAAGVMPKTYCGGMWRLISTGCEVVNTTAPLYKSGAVTVVRSPTNKAWGQFSSGVGAIREVWAEIAGMVPTSNADMALYPNAKTWSAADGVYMVGTLNDTEVPYMTPFTSAAGMMFPMSTTELVDQDPYEGWFPRNVTDGRVMRESACRVLPFDSSNAWFSGLNKDSTLQVSVKYYFERNPTVQEQGILVLARNPCPYDPVALEIVSRAMAAMPCAVPVGENPLGEWFNDVLQAVETWAPRAGVALSAVHPAAGAVGTALGSAAGVIHSITQSSSPARPPHAKEKKRIEKLQRENAQLASEYARTTKTNTAKKRKRRNRKRKQAD